MLLLTSLSTGFQVLDGLNIPFHSLTSENTGSIAVLKTALTYNETCATKHYLCRTVSVNSLPTRVANVAPEKTPFDVELEDVRFIYSDGKHAPYMSLTHCWGNNQFLRTTKGKHELALGMYTLKKLLLTLKDVI